MEVKAEQVLKLILDAARESRVLTGGVYKDEPILRTGRQAYVQRSRSKREPSLADLAVSLADLVSETTAPVPTAIARMRELARRSPYAAPLTNAEIFYRQAHFMAAYEDDCPYRGGFSRYYPTYEDMGIAQLRGYFTWRTCYRAGAVPEAPLSFLFVHVYELLCGAGVSSPVEGLAALIRLREAYGAKPGNEALANYLAVWIPDYIIYHGLDRALLGQAAKVSPAERAIFVLDRVERALLASPAAGKDYASTPGLPAQGDFTCALPAASRYRLERSRVFSERFDELAECCCAVFARMVAHCSKRRKRGFCEGLFGGEETLPYTMFNSAVFFDPAPPSNCTYELETGTVYACVSGRWSRHRPHSSPKASAELGDILHEVDRVLRERLGGFPELKPREVPKYVRAIVAEEVERCLERRAAEEAARVHIDRSALSGIRAAHERTREALLVDEEREDAPVAVAEPAYAPAPGIEPDAEYELPNQDASPAVQSAPAGLSAEDAAYLRALLDGVPAEAPGGMPSLAVDRINEALFDLIGDTVIEFDGDVPRIIEDYAEDVREALA